jgi:hypothetical protein
MKACLTVLIGCSIALLAPALAFGQDYHPAVYSNVPLNEISSSAYRHFQKLFPIGTTNEYWYASADGYQVSFQQSGHQHQAFFDRHGAYRYSLLYYPGKEIPREPGDLVKAKYPEYKIDVVTEITDGLKTFHLVKIVNPVSIKTLSVCDGEIELLEDLINNTPETPLISLRSAP